MSAILQSSWVYPALEVTHLVGISMLLGNLLLLECRVFGAAPAVPLEALARLGLTLAALGFGMAALTGVTMFAAQAGEFLQNRAFTLKMLLIVAAGCNAAWFHGRGSLRLQDRVARGQWILSTVIWLAVLACGRWIAYV